VKKRKGEERGAGEGRRRERKKETERILLFCTERK
jgi:hypothetical protein